ncbi:hypothetical protein SDRG_08869 [Saprolegnia diclina VS20]|uniref:Peptidase C1A papain C-terminal domain-containing protein n=1 Tax=Saprolegnia diclina (strain VS20) TaxID=1156394 RepID=T0RTU0_SAPDV|nr:hypothetical protein SDRG_08869 [Saprolegnia diclina VS20]EQC33767.1 hypothetical protein SDRG_08869 [Saprolegnia diclina VS20]|eukprot:XP_008612990.1 hypothetical protein SDRG_08869 [Saprolegnia diclina VS20]
MTTSALGTLVGCNTTCLWTGHNGDVVDSARLAEIMLANDTSAAAARNLQSHMGYIQEVQRHASAMGQVLDISLGVNPRHLLLPATIDEDPAEMVLEYYLRSPRRLQASTLQPSLNWCSESNPTGRSVCGDIKSQKLCGSCWAFAATDLIETAVAIAGNATPVSLSTQQLLSCSKGPQVHTFHYCFASSKTVPTWLSPMKQWNATNDGCGGGMTQNALTDAVSKIKNLASRLTWPDDDASSSSRSPYSCAQLPDDSSAAHITGWEPAVSGNSCANTSDPTRLLQDALATGPLAVAMHAQGLFPEYKGGVFRCPKITNSDMIDHALLLVGYGYSSGQPYWILKNSYGAGWGVNGFMHLAADDDINCGLNIFPIRVLGASRGASVLRVDGGGDLDFGGLTFAAWLGIAVTFAIGTLLATIVGVRIALKRRANMHRC